jgi:hypothetical protein
MVAVANKLLQNSAPRFTKFEDVQGVFNANLQAVLHPKQDGLEERSKDFKTEDKSFFDFSAQEGPSEHSVTSVSYRHVLQNMVLIPTRLWISFPRH